MKRFLPHLLSTAALCAIFFIFPMQQSNAQITGCWPQPAEKLEWVRCSSGEYVVRCDCGPGSCAPEMQELCDDDEA
jgi:hypothetical protein